MWRGGWDEERIKNNICTLYKYIVVRHKLRSILIFFWRGAGVGDDVSLLAECPEAHIFCAWY